MQLTHLLGIICISFDSIIRWSPIEITNYTPGVVLLAQFAQLGQLSQKFCFVFLGTTGHH